MKYLFLITLAISALHLGTSAQSQNIQYSASFDEPEDGWNKVLQLSNGNTFFFHFTKKNGIEVTVYNKDRKVSSEKSITSEVWEPRKMAASTIEGVYEIGGQPVIFLHQLLDRVPTLFRIILNAQTGAVESEKLICTLPKYKGGSAWAMAFGGVKPADFFVEKDPQSDNYAVVNFNTFAGESDERVEVIHYGVDAGKHKVLSKAYYDAQGFKYLNFLGMCVDGNKRVFVCTYGYNNRKARLADSRVIISRMNAGSNDFTHKKIEFSDDFKDTKALLQYNRGTNTLQLFTLTFMTSESKFWSGTSNYYLALMNYIDPESLFIVTTKPVLNKMANQYMKRKYDYEKGLGTLPQNMIINNDNSTTILSEEVVQQVTRNANTGAVMSANTLLGSVALTELDDKGNEQEGMALLKSQKAGGLIDAFYVNRKSKGLWSYQPGGVRFAPSNAFLSFDYINTEKGKYILFNDYPENYERDTEGNRKRKTVGGISECNTICYKLKYADYDKYYLMGEPASDKQSRFCYIEASHFLKQNNTYATLMIERDGRKKVAKIAWIKFD